MSCLTNEMLEMVPSAAELRHGQHVLGNTNCCTRNGDCEGWTRGWRWQSLGKHVGARESTGRQGEALSAVLQEVAGQSSGSRGWRRW